MKEQQLEEEDESGPEVDETIYMAADGEQKMVGGFGWNHAILDTDCKKSVAGTRWTEEYIKALSRKDKKEVKMGSNKGKQRFKFGGGMVCESKTVISAPVEIGGKKNRLS